MYCVYNREQRSATFLRHSLASSCFSTSLSLSSPLISAPDLIVSSLHTSSCVHTQPSRRSRHATSRPCGRSFKLRHLLILLIARTNNDHDGFDSFGSLVQSMRQRGFARRRVSEFLQLNNPVEKQHKSNAVEERHNSTFMDLCHRSKQHKSDAVEEQHKSKFHRLTSFFHWIKTT